MALENPWPQAVASGFVREKIQKVAYVSICLIHSPRAECSNAMGAFQGFWQDSRVLSRFYEGFGVRSGQVALGFLRSF